MDTVQAMHPRPTLYNVCYNKIIDRPIVMHVNSLRSLFTICYNVDTVKYITYICAAVHYMLQCR